MSSNEAELFYPYHMIVNSKPLRVCLITREYPPETGWGGIATFSRHLAHGLKELGHSVTVVSLAKAEPKVVQDDGVEVHRIAQDSFGKKLGNLARCMPYSRYVLLTSIGLWKKFFELHSKQPFDVIDTPELLAEGLYPAITKIAPLTIRLYTPHSKFIAEKLHNVTPSFDHQFVAALERVAMLSADAITSPSNDLANFVSSDLNYPRESITLIHNPIDPVQFAPEGSKALQSDGRLTVLFVGRLEERKGIHYLIDAIPQVLSKFSNVRFVIIGDDTNSATGQKSVLAELKASIRKHGCENAIQFIDRVPLTDLPSYYRSADICIVPSVYDNSPYTSLEAMSCGRPVIGTTGGGTPEYVSHEEAGLIVATRDSTALAEALLNLLQNDERRLQFGKNARKRVIEKFQRKEIARQTADLYLTARKRFDARVSNKYMKPPACIQEDATVFFQAFDKMIYDLLYQYSWRWRLSHWWHQIVHRPRLSAAKIAFKSALAVSAMTGNRLRACTKLAEWLRGEITKKQAEITSASQEV